MTGRGGLRPLLIWLWFLPAVAVLLPFFLLPLAIVVRNSVYRDDPDAGIVIPDLIGANYLKVLNDPYYLGVFGNTLLLAFVVTLLSLLVAYPFAQLIARVSPKARLLLLWCVYVPLYVSVIMRAFGWIVITADSGLINRALLALGLVSAPVKILYEAEGVGLGMLHRYLPLMIIPLVTALGKIDLALLRASANLGAGAWRTWREVTLPMSLPGAVAGMQLVFAGVLSDYAIPALMGSTRFPLAAPAMFYEAITNSSWALAGAMATLMLAAVLAAVVAMNLLVRRLAPWASLL